MELFIDTTERGRIKLRLIDGGKVKDFAEKRSYKISETLLSQIDKLLRKHKLKFQNLSQVKVNPGPGGFSSTRTGVATANSLNFVFGNDKVVVPKYDKQPNITEPKK